MEEYTIETERSRCQSIFAKCFPCFFKSEESTSLLRNKASSGSVNTVTMSDLKDGVDMESSFGNAKQIWDLYQLAEKTSINEQVDDRYLQSCYSILHREFKDKQCIKSERFLKENFSAELQEALNEKLELDPLSHIKSNDFV